MKKHESPSAIAGNRLALFVLVALLVGSPCGAVASIWTEQPDAGDLPLGSQQTVGVGTLDSIQGTLRDLDDVDLFAITISDLSLFSATTVSTNTTLVDTQLFLFDQNGRGIVANDDTDAVETNATIPFNTLAGVGGLYYLAISQWFDVPESGSDAIFPAQTTAGEILWPTGPGGADPVTGWQVDNFSQPQAEDYEILLTGAEYSAPIPEPSSMIIWALTLLAVSGTVFTHRPSSS